jgi:hypothetical protein
VSAQILLLPLKCPLCLGAGTVPLLGVTVWGFALGTVTCSCCKGTGRRPDFEGHQALVTPKENAS